MAETSHSHQVGGVGYSKPLPASSSKLASRIRYNGSSSGLKLIIAAAWSSDRDVRVGDDTPRLREALMSMLPQSICFWTERAQSLSSSSQPTRTAAIEASAHNGEALLPMSLRQGQVGKEEKRRT